MARLRPKLVATTFDIEIPDVDDPAEIDSNSTIFVRVTNKNEFNTGFIATIFDLGSGGAGQSVDLGLQGSGQIWQGRVPVPGTIPGTDPGAGKSNKTLRVQAVQSGSGADQQDNDFRAFGEPDIISLGTAAVTAHRCDNLPMANLMPVALQLRLDAPVRPGTCSHCDQLNRPTLLVYSNDVRFACCWFSPPIDFCADGAAPGWWMLEKTDPRTWTLVLQREEAEVVKYRLVMALDKDGSFPIQLQLTGPGGKECKNWPRTVTIVPAP
jgi:hypothetical protein